MPGEVLGIIGRNGSGKSTLLQLVCGTLTPSSGEVSVRGRVAALLELGAGFNPEFTGRENVFMSGAVLGLSKEEIAGRFDEIVDFSGIREFIDQPVKTYSSGMYVRLAFSVATSVDPDILVIDEALSVGDGEFSRKSFDRIMKLKEAGKTILFCSHNIYQIETLCKRALWLDRGQVQMMDNADMVCQRYNQFIDQVDRIPPESPSAQEVSPPSAGLARITKVVVTADDRESPDLRLASLVSNLKVRVSFSSNPDLPCPSIAVIIADMNGRDIGSCCNHYDQVTLNRDAQGNATAQVEFPRIQLLRGQYVINVVLLCEHALHIYDAARCAEFEVTQARPEVGVFALQRSWEQL